MIGETFGFTNGIITILALITGLHAKKVNKNRYNWGNISVINN